MTEDSPKQESSLTRLLNMTGVSGIVYGTLATTPLFLMKVVLHQGRGVIDEKIVYGSLSFIFWTLMIFVVGKYLVLALRTDNRGEGGILALFALMRKRSSKAALFVIAGVSSMIAFGVTAPAITIASSVDNFKLLSPELKTLPVAAGLIAVIFFLQRFKPVVITLVSGPVIILWLAVIAVTGLLQITAVPEVLKALNPAMMVSLFQADPASLVLPGLLILCIAGADSLYQELGQFGRKEIRYTGIGVTIILVISYFGQGALILDNPAIAGEINPVLAIVPENLRIPVILLALASAIVVAQAVINRTFTVVSEAVSLTFWPNIKILNPTLVKGQVYLPLVNWILWIATTVFVILLPAPEDMGAAYAFIVMAGMVSATIVLAYFYRSHEMVFGRWWHGFSALLLAELALLASVFISFSYGIMFALIIFLLFVLIMLGWYFGRKIKNRYISFANVSDYTQLLTDLHNDKSVPITATNLVYIIKAEKPEQVESKVFYSIFHRQPKRAETYWFLHIDRVDEPYRFDYEFIPIVPGVLHRVDFHLGFKVEPRINLYFREVLEDLVRSEEISLASSFESLKKFNFTGDFKYILIDRVMLRDNKLSALENFLLTLHNITRMLDITDERALHLDLTNTIVEQIPVTLEQPAGQRITRAP